MVDEVVTKKISTYLKQLYAMSKNEKNGWLKLQVIESATNVSRQTVSRILNGKANCLQYRTAVRLASYIEKETQGKVPVTYLLTESERNYVGANLRGIDFSSEDLTHSNFAQADLTGANFEGTKLDHSDFTAARLKDANFNNVTGTGTNFTGAVATGATFKNFQARFWNMTGLRMSRGEMMSGNLKASMHGANMHGVKINRMEWRVGGSASVGLRLPYDIDLSGFIWGLMNNSLVAVLVYQLFRNHPSWNKFSQIIDFILGQQFRTAEPDHIPCYNGLVYFVQTELPEVEDELLEGFQRYPAMQIYERYMLATVEQRISNLDQALDLKNSSYADLFPGIVKSIVRQWK
ncbi:MAG: pentapeptide repeat-containing protein [Candidatus Poribacteria bacterium]|nr:pentapeptide repeat-containing protein [Candidatus Poribacteria bacterium]